jgi:hypothetical protein
MTKIQNGFMHLKDLSTKKTTDVWEKRENHDILDHKFSWKTHYLWSI